MTSAPPMFGGSIAGLPPVPQGMLSMADFTGQAPSIAPVEETTAIGKLGPSTEAHQATLARLMKLFNSSKSAMTQHHNRWRYMEQRVQAYVSLPDYERAMQALSDNGNLPEPVKVIVPYTYATLHAAATYITTVLGGRKPIFNLTPSNGATTERAQLVEQALQYNMDRSRGLEVLFQNVWDSLTYGFLVGRVMWQEKRGNVISLVGGQRVTKQGLKFAGNVIQNIDPFCFFPDPRVPIWEGNRKGDFVFFTSQQSQMELKLREQSKMFRWVKETIGERGERAATMPHMSPVHSQRQARIGTAGQQNVIMGGDQFQMLLEGVVRLVPKDWKLGPGETPELWKFSILNEKQIVQAEPLNMEHGMLPYYAAEPTTTGYEFNSLSMADMISPFQDLISWFLNSRMENVRATIHSQFLVDPSRIEMGDVSKPAAGKLIRLKKTAIGLPIDQAIKQIEVHDVTAGHVGDIQNLRMLADTISGVSDNMRGVQTQGGRRSATEARIFMQAGASRLGQLAVRISAQGLSAAVEQMVMNLQQFMPDEMWINVAGEADVQKAMMLTPEMVLGDFNYQISDGTLPIDRQAALETWKEILMGVAQDPELRARFSLTKLFEFVAELGGARNISQFQNVEPGAAPGAQVPIGGAQVMDDAAIQALAGSGQLMPINARPA